MMTTPKLSLLIPTHNNAETVGRSLRSALEQRYRPLEICVYDEASRDGTREIVLPLLEEAESRGIATDFLAADRNSGPVRAWRVPLFRATGDWACFVWSDDLLEPEFSEMMMAGAERAQREDRHLVFSSARLEIDGRTVTKYSREAALLSPVEFSVGIFLRRYSLNQINGIYKTAAAREVFDRHVDIENPFGFDYSRQAYGNDVGFLSELAMSGGGVELIGERLTRLVLSRTSMTRAAMAQRRWQFRWQYTYNFLRVWRWWQAAGVASIRPWISVAERRLALCELFLRSAGAARLAPDRWIGAARAAFDFLRWDYERRPTDTAKYRALLRRFAN